VEVRRVVVDVLRRPDQVAEQPSVRWDGRAVRALGGLHATLVVVVGADATDALCEEADVTRVATLHDLLEATEGRARADRLLDQAGVVDLDLDAQVSLDARDGI